jgi:hypothetical protein
VWVFAAPLYFEPVKDLGLRLYGGPGFFGSTFCGIPIDGSPDPAGH